MSDEDTTQFEGLEDDEATAIGFGGIKVGRVLELDDEFYVLLHCKVVSTGRSKKKSDADGLKFSAGVSTTLLRELSAQQATQIAAE